MSRYDVASDVKRIFDNAVKFNGGGSMYGVSAAYLVDLFQKLFDARLGDVDSSYFVSSEMRMQLHDNMYALTSPNRLLVMHAKDAR